MPARCMRSTRFPLSSHPRMATTGFDPSAQRRPLALSSSRPSKWNSGELHARRNAGTCDGSVVIVRFSAPSIAFFGRAPMRAEFVGIAAIWSRMASGMLSGVRRAVKSYCELKARRASTALTPSARFWLVRYFSCAMLASIERMTAAQSLPFSASEYLATRSLWEFTPRIMWASRA